MRMSPVGTRYKVTLTVEDNRIMERATFDKGSPERMMSLAAKLQGVTGLTYIPQTTGAIGVYEFMIARGVDCHTYRQDILALMRNHIAACKRYLDTK